MIVALRSPEFYKILTINRLCVILILYKSFQKISKRLVVFKSLYYDLDAGRIIIDDISYLDPETINGINLYAYCRNNVVIWRKISVGSAFKVRCFLSFENTLNFGMGLLLGSKSY